MVAALRSDDVRNQNRRRVLAVVRRGGVASRTDIGKSTGLSAATVSAITSDFLEEGDTFSVRQKFAYESNGDGVLSSSIVAWAPDDKLEILGFQSGAEEDVYLLSVGILAGDKIEVMGIAPFGGPISCKHEDNTFFALRRDYAAKIKIKVLS